MNKLILTASLAATAMGVAVSTSGTPSSTTALVSAATVCSGDTTSSDGVQALHDTSGAVDYLDIMLGIFWDHESDWVTSLWNQEFPKGGQSPLTGCGDIDGQCTESRPCSEFSNAMTYWVLQSVQILHGKMDAARSLLTYKGWIDSLTIDQIGNDFSVPAPDNSWAAFAAVAFGMASSVGDGAGIMTNLISNIFWAVDSVSGDGNTVDTASVKNTLSKIAGAVGDSITQLMKDATGNGDASRLPVLVDSTLQYATSRFYSQPGILVDENKDNSIFAGDFDNFLANLNGYNRLSDAEHSTWQGRKLAWLIPFKSDTTAQRGLTTSQEKKLVILAMNSAHYILLDDTDAKQKYCNKKGQIWLTAGNSERCFYLTRPSTSQGCSDDPTTCNDDAWQTPYDSSNQMDTGIYDKLTDTYGFDLEALYKSAIDCALNGNGQVEKDNVIDGVPRCYWNIWTGSGSFAAVTSDEWKELDYLKPLEA